MRAVSSVGLDVGGSYLKAAWLDEGPLRISRTAIPGFIDSSGSAREIDPSALMDAITDLLDEVTASRRCDRILITGQMAGLAFVDERGHPMAPLVSWQDTRFDAVDRVRVALTSEQLDCLGDGLRVGLPLVTLTGLEVPHDARVTSLIGFVAGALTGSFPSKIHTSDAASLGLLDVPHARWSQPALACAHIDADRLPTPTVNVESLGVCPTHGAEIFTPVGDQQAALLGVGLREGQVSMNIATGCQVSVVSPSSTSPAQLRPYFGARYLHTVTHLPAGGLLTSALERDLGHAPSDDDWQRAMEDENGEYPATDSALQEIAAACVQAAQRISHPTEVVFSGGVARRAPKLRRIIGDALPVPQVVHVEEDASIAGLRKLDTA